MARVFCGGGQKVKKRARVRKRERKKTEFVFL